MYKCKFCNIISEKQNIKGENIVFENEHFIVILDKYRRTSAGAICLVIPKLHKKNILELNLEESRELIGLIRLVSKSMQLAYQCKG